MSSSIATSRELVLKDSSLSSGSGGGPFSIIGVSSNQIKVSLYSSLLRSEDPHDKIAITGLNNPRTILSSPVSYLWLDIDLTKYPTITANIPNFSPSGWSGFPIATSFITDENGNRKQTHAYILICTVIRIGKEGVGVIPGVILDSGDNVIYVAYRHIFADLMLVSICDIGTATKIIPWVGASAVIV